MRAFAEREVLPQVERLEREARYPTELIARLAELGLLGPMIPSNTRLAQRRRQLRDSCARSWRASTGCSRRWSASATRSGERDLTPAARRRNSAGCRRSPAALPRFGMLDRAGRRDRSRRDADARAKGARRVRATRREGVHLARRARRPVLSRRHARSEQAARGRDRVPVDVAATRGIEISALAMRTLQRDNLASVRFDDAFVPEEAVLGAPGSGFPSSDRRSTWAAFGGRALLRAGTALRRSRPALRSERRAFGKAIRRAPAIQHNWRT